MRAAYEAGAVSGQTRICRADRQDFREAARIDPTDFQVWQKYEETYRHLNGGQPKLSRLHTPSAGKLRATLRSSTTPQ